MSFLHFILLLFTVIAIVVAVAILGDKSSDPSSTNPYLVSTFKYEKRVADAVEEANSETDCCAVCLSGFEDGNDVKQLPRCKHSFHAPCIDMWLKSHSDCPVCRAPVDRLASNNRPLALQGNSQHGEDTLNISISA